MGYKWIQQGEVWASHGVVAIAPLRDLGDKVVLCHGVRRGHCMEGGERRGGLTINPLFSLGPFCIGHVVVLRGEVYTILT